MGSLPLSAATLVIDTFDKGPFDLIVDDMVANSAVDFFELESPFGSERYSYN